MHEYRVEVLTLSSKIVATTVLVLPSSHLIGEDVTLDISAMERLE